MREISLHLLDIAENSVTAGASRIKLNLTEAHSRDRLYLSVIDNGKGIPGAILETVKDPQGWNGATASKPGCKPMRR